MVLQLPPAHEKSDDIAGVIQERQAGSVTQDLLRTAQRSEVFAGLCWAGNASRCTELALLQDQEALQVVGLAHIELNDDAAAGL